MALEGAGVIMNGIRYRDLNGMEGLEKFPIQVTECLSGAFWDCFPLDVWILHERLSRLIS